MLEHSRLTRLPLVSLRHWHTLQAEAVRHPIVTVLHNGQQIHAQKGWEHRVRGWFVIDDPPPGTSIVRDYRGGARSVWAGVFDFIFQQLPILLIAVWFGLMAGPFLLPFLGLALILGFTFVGGTTSSAGLFLQLEVEGDRFDLLALTPGGAAGVFGAVAATYARRTPPRSVRRLRWPGRVAAALVGGTLLTIVVWGSLFTPPVFLGYLLAVTEDGGPGSAYVQLQALINSLHGGAHHVGVLGPLVQLGLLYGLLNLPLVLIVLALILVDFAQSMAIGHMLATLAWTYVRQRNVVQALAGMFMVAQRMGMAVLVALLGGPLARRIVEEATPLPNMLPYYAVMLVVLVVVFTMNEGTARLLDGWLRRRVD
jgi:hypothetical protein